MPDAYGIFDGRFSQFRTATSAADALNIGVGPVPAQRVWTVRQVFANCSAAETQYYWFAIYVHAYLFPFTRPENITINSAISRYHPGLTEGMEIKLFPGEYLYTARAAATAGSTIGIFANIIETALPLYEEYEPQDRVKQIKAGTIIRRVGRGGSGGGGAPSGTIGPGGAPPVGGGTTIPI